MRTINDYLLGFEKWIIAHNFESTSIYNDSKRVEEFLTWVQVNHSHLLQSSLLEIGSQTVDLFFDYLKHRPNLTRGGALSLATLRNYQMSLRRFSRQLEQANLGRIDVSIILKKDAQKIPAIFSIEQIEALYASFQDDAVGQRDRVLLGIYYGCGLRKSEGATLQVKDIMLEKSLLYVRHGKGGKSRYVPMVGRIKKDLLIYLQDGRKQLLKGRVSQALFIGCRMGRAMNKNGLYSRFKIIQDGIIEQPKGLHALRHSIATHLLWEGMPLHFIARFLGHASIESTQIYTQIKYEKLPPSPPKTPTRTNDH